VDREPPQLDGVSHRFVAVGGLRTHVAEAGEGPVLLLLHGWPQNWWMWHELIGPLSESHRVLCPDLRGFGWTDAPATGYDPEVFASDLVALLDTLGVEGPVDLAGHDWGGWTGFMLCLRHPERVRRFLALNIYHPFGTASPRSLLSVWRLWYQWVLALPVVGRSVIRGGAAAEPLLRWVGTGQAPWSEEDVENYLAQFREPARAQATSLLYRHAVLRLAPAVARGEYRRLHMETEGLMLFGTDDHVQSARLMTGFEGNAPNMRLDLVPEVGHFIVDERPDLVLERARRLFTVDADGIGEDA
jgi:pimeloyl-ACP methyl ester carboxylesterase